MITKTIIKDYVLKKCAYLTSLELEDKTLIGLLKESIDSKNKYRELALEEKEYDKTNDENDEFNLYEVLKDYPHLKKEIKEYEKQIPKNAVEELIEKYNDNQLVSKLSRQYFENIYGKENCKRCDVDEFENEILDQKVIQKLTNQYLVDPKVKVIFEGQLIYKDLRARFDVLIRNIDGSFDLIEVKGTNSVFDHPSKDKTVIEDIDTRIKSKYLYDLLFQYYVYKNAGLDIKDVGYMYTNKRFELSTPFYPIKPFELNSLFEVKKDINLKSGTISIKEYFDKSLYMYKDGVTTLQPENQSIYEILHDIDCIKSSNEKKPVRQYLCRKGPRCPFIDLCFNDANDSNSIFKLTNWNLYGGYYGTTKKLIEDNIYKISDIPSDTFKEFNAKGKRLNVYNQIRYQKGEIKEKYLIDMEKVKEILKNDYINENINWLIFFDFESFQHCIPLVKDSTPWRQVVSQYSMHIVRSDYDLSKHDFESGRGGQIYHYEFIGNPDKDKFDNPSVALYKTLKEQLLEVGIDPLASNYKVIVFNRNFEESRMKEFTEHPKFSKDVSLKDFVKNFKNNIVDLLDFFTSGSIYCKNFDGRGSLKVVQPTFAEDENVINYYKNVLNFDLSYSLDYHKGEQCLVYNGAICLDLYKSLLIRSHLGKDENELSTDDLLKEALAYCKIDSWGTVIIFDIIKNICEGNLKLDCLQI